MTWLINSITFTVYKFNINEYNKKRVKFCKDHKDIGIEIQSYCQKIKQGLQKQ